MRVRRAATAVVILTVATVVGFGGGPAGAASSGEADLRPEPRIFGGTAAPAGAWPSQVALVEAGEAPTAGQFCSGTVVARTWVLTAAHCITRPDGAVYPARSQDVLAGTQDLSGGGARIAVVEVRRHPSYDEARLTRDVALLRLDRPVPASAVPAPLAASGQDPAGGTAATAVGWGRTNGTATPAALRQATVTVRNPSGCTIANGGLFDAATMLCGTGDGTRGVCAGDSGGALMQQRSGTWTVVGVASWTYDCGARDSVYARVSALSAWVAAQTRYGVHPDAASFVRRQYLDVHGRPPTGNELAAAVAGLQGGQSPAAYVAGLLASDAFDDRTGGVVRLYQAVFLRRPDSGGLMYWKVEVDRGVGLKRIADQMVRAPEFVTLYGSLSDAAFVDLVYDNVLGRAPSSADRDYWVAELTSGRRSRGAVMVGFSESPEYVGSTRAVVSVVGAFGALVRRAPTGGEVAQWSGQPPPSLTTSLLASLTYASRF